MGMMSMGGRGGFSGMSDALAKPMVLVMSLWDDVSLSSTHSVYVRGGSWKSNKDFF